jgi:hypothetical protein
MKTFLLLGLILMISITTCGCAQQTPVSSSESTPSPTVDTDVPASQAGLSSALLSNDHPNVSVPLEPGILLVSFDAAGPQVIHVNQECSQSWSGSAEVRTTSPYSGILAFGVPETDTCDVNISSSGTWTAELSMMDMSNPLEIPVNLSGSGTSVSPAFMLEKGQYMFQREETGEASPRYEIMYANGNWLMDANQTFVQPAFERFSNETFRIIDISQSGTYFLSVSALEENPNPWNVSIIPLPAVPSMGPGPAIK